MPLHEVAGFVGNSLICRIKKDGIFFLPYQSGCRARLNSDQTGIVTGTWTLLEIVDTSDYDAQGEFNNTTHRFTATEDGRYLVCVNARIGSLSDGNLIGVIVAKNGDYVGCHVIHAEGAAGNPLVAASDVIDLDATDYLELYVRHDYGSNRTAPAEPYQNYMAVHKIA